MSVIGLRSDKFCTLDMTRKHELISGEENAAARDSYLLGAVKPLMVVLGSGYYSGRLASGTPQTPPQ